MSNLTVMIIDDEPLAVRRLELALKKLSGVACAGSASGCEDGLPKLLAVRPDILLLDICMRDGTGFDLLASLPDDTVPVVIFVTAFDHFAVRAFESIAVDYVLKPVEVPRLRDAIERARAYREATSAADKINELRTTLNQLRARIRETERAQGEGDLWAYSNGGGYTRIVIDEIEYATSEDDYVRLHTPNGSYLLRLSIRALEAKLNEGEFIRVHRSALVRRTAIKAIRKEKLGRYEVILQNGRRIAAGRVYAKRMRDLLLRSREETTNPFDN